MLIRPLLASLLAVSSLTAQRDDSSIRLARAHSNNAIAAHDVDGTVAVMHPSYTSVSSTNARSINRDAARASYTQIFATRSGVVFVRTPTAITVNRQWGQAAESGRWTGAWSGADGALRVGGLYFAKWVKTDGAWMLYSETFVQTSCTGKHFCESAPAIP